MKRQYLGDEKDAFKWDYLDFLTQGLDLSVLNIALMMTPDDGSNHGRTDPARFYKKQQQAFSDSRGIVRFCKELREVQRRQGDAAFTLLKGLPDSTGAGGKYAVKLHKGLEDFAALDVEGARRDYFDGFSKDDAQVVFLDPDTGFAPSRPTSAHVTHGEVEHILRSVHDDSVVVVFQHFNRTSFKDCFQNNTRRYPRGQSTAIYWNGRVMLFAFGNSAQIGRVCDINNRYCDIPRPVEVLK